MAGRPSHIVVAEPLAAQAIARLRTVGSVDCLDDCSPPALRAAVAECDALIVRTYATVDAALIAAAPRLRVIARAGVGLENIDVAAAVAAGVVVVHRPAAATQAVAEFTLGLILALQRHLLEGAARCTPAGFLEGRATLIGRELGECTLGIIGCGRIGQCLARVMFRAFGMRILYSDIRAITPDGFTATSVALPTLLANADIITLHVPLTDRTRHLIDADALRHVRPTALLINTARGAVIDAAAVATALHENRLAGAAIDVFDPEPPAVTHPLCQAPRCLTTPHMAARTVRALAGMNDVVEDVVAVLEGRAPAWPANQA